MTSLSNSNWCNLFTAVNRAGCQLALSGDKLVIERGNRLSAQIVQDIRDHKTEVTEILKRSSGLVCPRCSAAQVAVPTFDGFENIECFNCGNCSGCRRVVRALVTGASC